MAAEQLILCGGVHAPSGWADALRLNGYGTSATVGLTVEDLYQGVYTPLAPAFRDLVDVAAYVYAADQATPRSGRGDGNFGANWRRTLVFRIPVRVPELWRSAAVHDVLVDTLSFLSEDEYRFEFSPAEAQKSPTDGAFDFRSTCYDGCAEEVVMFSGGLDSLGGAVRESVVGKRKVLLVNHRSNPKPGPRHERLVEGLRRHAGDSAPFHVRVRINKTAQLTRETTQRSRSFLYAALGATFAQVIGLPRVRFYENGVVSLNLPIGRQVVGARATRTTHPRVLRGFSQLFTELAGRALGVENGFIGLTKTDVVEEIVRAGCGNLIADTVSCTETYGRSNQYPHCGVCTQCIDRRFAVLAAGQSEADPSGGYEVNLLTGDRTTSQHRTLLAAYLDTADRVSRMSPAEFAARYGELARVLRHLSGSPGETSHEVYRVYRRHSDQVVGALDRAVSDAASRGEYRNPELSHTSLLRLMTPEIPSPPVVLADAEPEYLFRWTGQAYSVRYAGGDRNILFYSKGAAYLHALLSQPDKVITAVELASGVARRRLVCGLESEDEVMDREELAAVRERVVELREEIEDAKEQNDVGRQAAAERELDELTAELQRSAGFGGRVRRMKGDLEAIRKAMTTNVGRAIQAIAKFDQRLADHLKANVKRGRKLTYTPNGIRWVI